VKRRRLVAVALFAAPLVAVAVACTFPDVTFGPIASDEGGAQEGGNPDTGTTTTDGSSDGGPADAIAADVVRREDGGGVIVDASICEAKARCDCDDDEYADMNCDVDAAGLKSAKGNPLMPGDCDDLDGLRHPGQGYVDEVPAPGKDGNWDCTMPIEYFPVQNLTCGGIGLTGCSGGSGFVTAPPCGTESTFYSCEPQTNALAPCQPKPTGSSTRQACK
jgi:hypothetical protein